MRLLQTTTLQLEEFFASSRLGDQAIPKYAILSHTFSTLRRKTTPIYRVASNPEFYRSVNDLLISGGSEEISLQDIMGNRAAIRHKIGFKKIRYSCRQALADGYAYIWIDTCCIDKTSSAELSEAINSMYQWYKDSAICYAYLSDILTQIDPSDSSTHPRQPFYTEDGRSSLAYSRWFSRGWTLQELLAPVELQFFDKDWNSIGMKNDLAEIISEITNIDLYALNGGDLRRLSIARRMSWAANRQTTRVEDMAYCLLGVFGIHMPLLYGEGVNAFVRLQEEILKISNDQSLFAWKHPHVEFYQDGYSGGFKVQGLLAPTPEVFRDSDAISQFYSETAGRAFPVSTNKGVQVEFLMCQDMGYPSGLVYLAMLDCPVGRVPGRLPAIHLKRLSPSSEQYTRVDTSQLYIFGSYDSTGRIELEGFDPRKSQRQLVEIRSKTLHQDWTIQTVFIKQDTQFALPPGFWLVIPEPFSEFDMVVNQAHPRNFWDPTTRFLQPHVDSRQGLRTFEARKLGALLVRYEKPYGSSITRLPITYHILIFGIAYGGLVPWCYIGPAPRYEEVPVEQRSLSTQEHPSYVQQPPTDTYLQRQFDGFHINSALNSLGPEARGRHVHICKTSQLVTIAELKSVSGKEVYLLHLLTFSKYRDEMTRESNDRDGSLAH